MRSAAYQYSKAGGGICFEGKPGDPPDFTIYSRPDGALAWAEPYIARFPFSTTAARLRKILGSSVSSPPFPLMNSYTGLNATCAFRKSYEFQPVNGASVPAVTTISPGSLFSIYGQNFVPEGAGRRVNPDELVNGVLPGALLGVCVGGRADRAGLGSVSRTD